jgi:hypothetical protein
MDPRRLRAQLDLMDAQLRVLRAELAELRLWLDSPPPPPGPPVEPRLACGHPETAGLDVSTLDETITLCRECGART